MKLDLRLLNVPLEDLWCEVVAALVFEELFESQGPVYSLDTRTGGRLSSLRESGFWMGSEGSSLLLPSEKKIKSEKILLRGLGNRADFSEQSFLSHVMKLGKSLSLLKCKDLAVWIPSPVDPGEETNALFRVSCKTLLDGYLESHAEEDQDTFVKVVFSVPHGTSIDLQQTAEFLRNEFGSRYSCSIIVAGEEQNLNEKD